MPETPTEILRPDVDPHRVPPAIKPELKHLFPESYPIGPDTAEQIRLVHLADQEAGAIETMEKEQVAEDELRENDPKGYIQLKFAQAKVRHDANSAEYSTNYERVTLHQVLDGKIKEHLDFEFVPVSAERKKAESKPPIVDLLNLSHVVGRYFARHLLGEKPTTHQRPIPPTSKMSAREIERFGKVNPNRHR